MIRRILSRLGQWVDESSVTHYQTVCYIAFIVAGAQTVVWNPPTAVARAMGEAADTVWAVMLIVCPLLTLAGTWLMRRDVAGLWLRLAGDIGCAAATFSYVAAVVQATWGANATFAGATTTAIGVCILVVIARDVRLIRSVRRRAWQLDDEQEVAA